jgi:hypothetical protein
MKINQTTDWGYYVVQADEYHPTVTLTAEFGFTKPPGYITVECDLNSPFTFSRASGNACLAGWGPLTDASICAGIVGDGGFSVASVKMMVLDRGTSNIPINVQQLAPIQITKLILAFFVDEPGAQTFSWCLVLT